MLENTINWLEAQKRHLRNVVENRRQIQIVYYPTEVKGRVYKSDVVDGREIYFIDLETKQEAF